MKRNLIHLLTMTMLALGAMRVRKAKLVHHHPEKAVKKAVSSWPSPAFSSHRG